MILSPAPSIKDDLAKTFSAWTGLAWRALPVPPFPLGSRGPNLAYHQAAWDLPKAFAADSYLLRLTELLGNENKKHMIDRDAFDNWSAVMHLFHAPHEFNIPTCIVVVMIYWCWKKAIHLKVVIDWLLENLCKPNSFIVIETEVF